MCSSTVKPSLKKQCLDRNDDQKTMLGNDDQKTMLGNDDPCIFWHDMSYL